MTYFKITHARNQLIIWPILCQAKGKDNLLKDYSNAGLEKTPQFERKIVPLDF